MSLARAGYAGRDEETLGLGHNPGGMGEVYRAVDTNLKPAVAIKQTWHIQLRRVEIDEAQINLTRFLKINRLFRW